MRDDCIAVALGLPQLRILWQKELGGHFEITVIYRRKEAICPRCGKVTTKEHDRRPQYKQDRRLRDKVVLLILMKRRFRCPFCGRVFTEPDEVFSPRRRSSCRFREYLGREALHQTVRRTAKKEQVGEGLVRRCVAEEVGRRLGTREVTETPEFIGLDELGLLEERIANGSLPEFKELLHTLGNWREEILNYFDYRITNGFVEGKNNRIKTIKRMAYGYRNMDNFRMRILATNPGCEVRFSHLLT